MNTEYSVARGVQALDGGRCAMDLDRGVKPGDVVRPGFPFFAASQFTAVASGAASCGVSTTLRQSSFFLANRS